LFVLGEEERSGASGAGDNAGKRQLRDGPGQTAPGTAVLEGVGLRLLLMQL